MTTVKKPKPAVTAIYADTAKGYGQWVVIVKCGSHVAHERFKGPQAEAQARTFAANVGKKPRRSRAAQA